jgi:hypothetical protein
MDQAALKGLLALPVTLALVAASGFLYHTRSTAGRVLQSLGLACFAIVALTHFFEVLAVFPAAGWGQARSIGHFIDVAAAFLGLTLVLVGLVVQFVQRRRG